MGPKSKAEKPKLHKEEAARHNRLVNEHDESPPSGHVGVSDYIALQEFRSYWEKRLKKTHRDVMIFIIVVAGLLFLAMGLRHFAEFFDPTFVAGSSITVLSLLVISIFVMSWVSAKNMKKEFHRCHQCQKALWGTYLDAALEVGICMHCKKSVFPPRLRPSKQKQ